jgi:hypothetical protein
MVAGFDLGLAIGNRFKPISTNYPCEGDYSGVAELMYDMAIAKRCLGRSREGITIQFVETYRD